MAAAAELTFCDGFAERITRAWVTPPFDIDDNRLVKENLLRVEIVFATSLDKVVKKVESLIAVNGIVRRFMSFCTSANKHKNGDHLVRMYRLQPEDASCVLLFLCRMRKRVINWTMLPSTESWFLDYVEVGIPRARDTPTKEEMAALASFYASRNTLERFEEVQFVTRRRSVDKIKLD